MANVTGDIVVGTTAGHEFYIPGSGAGDTTRVRVHVTEPDNVAVTYAQADIPATNTAEETWLDTDNNLLYVSQANNSTTIGDGAWRLVGKATGEDWDTYTYTAAGSLTVPQGAVLACGDIQGPFNIDLVCDNATLAINMQNSNALIPQGTISAENATIQLINDTTQSRQFPSVSGSVGITNLNLRNTLIQGQATNASPASAIIHLRALDGGATVDVSGLTLAGDVVMQLPLLVELIGVIGPTLGAGNDRVLRYVAPKAGTDSSEWGVVVDGDWSNATGTTQNIQLNSRQYTGSQELLLIGPAGQFGSIANMHLGTNQSDASSVNKTMRRMFAWNPQFVDSGTNAQINDARLMFTLAENEAIYKPSGDKTTALTAALSATGWITDDSNGYWYQTDEIAGTTGSQGTNDLAMQHGTGGVAKTVNVKSYTHIAPTATVTTTHHVQDALASDGSGFAEEQSIGWSSDSLVGTSTPTIVNALDGSEANSGTGTNIYRRIKGSWWASDTLTEAWGDVIDSSTAGTMIFDRPFGFDVDGTGTPTIIAGGVTVPLSHSGGLIGDDIFNALEATNINIDGVDMSGFSIDASETLTNLGDTANSCTVTASSITLPASTTHNGTRFNGATTVGGTNVTLTDVTVAGNFTSIHSGLSVTGGQLGGTVLSNPASFSGVRFTGTNVSFTGASTISGNTFDPAGASQSIVMPSQATFTNNIFTDGADLNVAGDTTITGGSMVEGVEISVTDTAAGCHLRLTDVAGAEDLLAADITDVSGFTGGGTYQVTPSGSTSTTLAAFATAGWTVNQPAVTSTIRPSGTIEEIRTLGGFFGYTDGTTHTVVVIDGDTDLDDVTLSQTDSQTTAYKVYYKPANILGANRVGYNVTFANFVGSDATNQLMAPSRIASILIETATSDESGNVAQGASLTAGLATFQISNHTNSTTSRSQSLALAIGNRELFFRAHLENGIQVQLVSFGTAQNTVYNNGNTSGTINDPYIRLTSTSQQILAASTDFRTADLASAAGVSSVITSSVVTIVGTTEQISQAVGNTATIEDINDLKENQEEMAADIRKASLLQPASGTITNQSS